MAGTTEVNLDKRCDEMAEALKRWSARMLDAVHDIDQSDAPASVKARRRRALWAKERKRMEARLHGSEIKT